MALIAKERDLSNTATVIVTQRFQDGEIMANFRYNRESSRLVRTSQNGAQGTVSGNGRKTTFMVLNEGRLVFQGSQKPNWRSARTITLRASCGTDPLCRFKTKLSWAQLRVGLMALVSLIILVIVIVLVTGDRSIFAGNSTIYTYMNDATALAEGAPVTLNGFTVGKVAKVELSGLKDPQKIVKITMEVQDEYMSQIPSDSVTELTAPNLLGTKFMNIKKGRVRRWCRTAERCPR